MKISIIGMGRLGMPMAKIYSGHNKVIGVDIDEAVIKKLKKENDNENFPNLTFTTDLNYALLNTDYTIILIGSQTKQKRGYSPDIIMKLAFNIGDILRTKESKFHFIIISSTLMPGDTAKFKTKVEKHALKPVKVVYAPEFLALGRVGRDIKKPAFILIGSDDKESGIIAEKMYKRIPEIECYNYIHTNTVTAELAKICLNFYLVQKINYGNMIAELCERIPGTDCDKISEILISDERIAAGYLKGATAYGGTCFPKDVEAFEYLTHIYKTFSMHPIAMKHCNNWQTTRLSGRIIKILETDSRIKKSKVKIAVLGLAFKVNTDVIEGSASLELIKWLSMLKGLTIWAHDHEHNAIKQTKKIFRNIKYSKNIWNCIKNADITIVMHSDMYYKMINKETWQNANVKNVYDCWRIYPAGYFKNSKVRYYSVGKFSEQLTSSINKK